MRITLRLDDDAVDVLQAYAKKRGLSIGRAASELIGRGARYQLAVRLVNGLPVFETPVGFPPMTTRRVRELLAAE